MTKEDFKDFCRTEFGITAFSNPESYGEIRKIFGVGGRTMVQWCYKNNVQDYFESASKLYLENKRLEAENKKLSESLADFNKRMETLTS